MKHSLALVAAVLQAALTLACASEGPECRVGADCASGSCNAEGRCVPAPQRDAQADALAADAAPPPADGPAPDGPTPPEAGPGCTPNKDGRITRDEVPLAAGLRATFVVALDADVSTAGTPRGDGTRSWDFSAALPGDRLSLLETQKLDDKWYRASFPGATYAARLGAGSELLGVFEVGAGAVKLRGVASPADGLSKTLLTYAPPVDVLAFPLEPAKAWSVTSSVSGTASGVALFGNYTEKYDSQVDAKGELKTPLGTFAVLRVKTTLTRTVGLLLPVTLRTFAFVTECYGTIATVTSNNDEPNVEFTRAKEVQRISP